MEDASPDTLIRLSIAAARLKTENQVTTSNCHVVLINTRAPWIQFFIIGKDEKLSVTLTKADSAAGEPCSLV